MAVWQDMVDEAVERADRASLGWFLTRVSIDPPTVRQQWTREGRAHLVSGLSTQPSVHEVDSTARWVISRAAQRASTLGGVAGLGGVLSVPPEALAFLVTLVRLAQRLVLVYGMDPQRESGRMLVSRALHRALDGAWPQHGLDQVRISELFTTLGAGEGRGALPRVSPTVWLRRVVSTGLQWLGSRTTRMLPVLASGVSVVDNHRRVSELGETMRRVIRREAHAALPDEPAVQDAVIVERP